MSTFEFPTLQQEFPIVVRAETNTQLALTTERKRVSSMEYTMPVYFTFEWWSDCCLISRDQFCSYIITITSCI